MAENRFDVGKEERGERHVNSPKKGGQGVTMERMTGPQVRKTEKESVGKGGSGPVRERKRKICSMTIADFGRMIRQAGFARREEKEHFVGGEGG